MLTIGAGMTVAFRASAEGLSPDSASPGKVSIAGFGKAWGQAKLEQLRGGFSVAQGNQSLNVSFAIQQVAYINGQLVAQTALTLPEGMTGSSLAQSALPPQVIQMGANNQFALPLGSPQQTLTVIQNSLNGQSIATATIIDATVTARQFLHGVMVSHLMSDALARARF